ncbi:hypothetical protein C1J01_00635, partial [Nonomuraea aridisoli]
LGDVYKSQVLGGLGSSRTGPPRPTNVHACAFRQLTLTVAGRPAAFLEVSCLRAGGDLRVCEV